jgi:hypothetical protein
MNPTPFDVLIGLRLAIVRRAADMLVVHFGEIRPHPSDADHLVFPAPAVDEGPL